MNFTARPADGGTRGTEDAEEFNFFIERETALDENQSACGAGTQILRILNDYEHMELIRVIRLKRLRELMAIEFHHLHHSIQTRLNLLKNLTAQLVPLFAGLRSRHPSKSPIGVCKAEFNPSTIYRTYGACGTGRII